MSGSACFAARAIAAAPSRRGDDVVAVRGERDPQRADELRVVVGDQDPHAHLVSRRRRGSAITMVSPPPGVSSGVSVPPMPSVNPFDSARPEAQPRRVVGVAQALERGEHLVALRPGARRPRGR